MIRTLICTSREVISGKVCTIRKNEFTRFKRIFYTSSNTYLTTTLAFLDLMKPKLQMKMLEEPLLRLTVPEEELDTARDLNAWENLKYTIVKQALPKWCPNFFAKMGMKFINLEKKSKIQVKNSANAILRMYEAGIPIVVGSDASNHPVFINFFHGPTTIREIELLGEIGIPPISVISSATRIPAEMMGIENQIGTVEVGKRADLIIVKDDPLHNLQALRNILWTIKDGDARKPKEWMESY